MHVINKIKNKINKKSNDDTLSNIEKVNANLYHKPNTNDYCEDDTILFI